MSNLQFQDNSILIESFGTLVMNALSDDNITEVMINPDGLVWIEKGGNLENTGTYLNTDDRWQIVRLLAASTNSTITDHAPTIRGVLPLPSIKGRFEAIIPPVSTAPVITIRKHSSKIIELDRYVDSGTLTFRRSVFIKERLKRRENFLIVGGTGSGKTTLARSLLKCISNLGFRVVVIEDTKELFVESENFVFLESCESASTGDLVRTSLRLRPDSIVIGEARAGHEAIELIKAWNTGHGPGVATVHANSARSALNRIENLISEVSVSSLRETIANSINHIIYIEKNRNKRVVSEVIEVQGLGKHKDYLLEVVS